MAKVIGYILARLPQRKATEHDICCKSHERKIEVRSIDVMTRRLVFQTPCHLLCYSSPMALYKKELTNQYQFELAKKITKNSSLKRID
jgi:hypothetical protein